MIEQVQINLQLYSMSPSKINFEKIQSMDADMNSLYNKFNNVFPFTYNNFKRDIRDVWIPIKHSVENKWKES